MSTFRGYLVRNRRRTVEVWDIRIDVSPKATNAVETLPFGEHAARIFRPHRIQAPVMLRWISSSSDGVGTVRRPFSRDDRR